MQKPLTHAFRMTHIDNIPHIMQHGIVRADSPNRNPDYVAIGDSSVIDSRREKEFQGIKIGNCIPFYFGPRTPMLYVIHYGHNGVKRVHPSKIVYCVIELADIVRNQISCFFTDGHALNGITKFYNGNRLPEINDLISREDVFAIRWDTEDNDLKRRKEAELLIFSDLPYEYIKMFVVYDDEAKKVLVNYGIEESKIIVSKKLYF